MNPDNLKNVVRSASSAFDVKHIILKTLNPRASTSRKIFLGTLKIRISIRCMNLNISAMKIAITGIKLLTKIPTFYLQFGGLMRNPFNWPFGLAED